MNMDKKYKHKEVEQKVYKMWEEGEYFKAKIDPEKKPYTILLPPPNASGKMHTGNVLMIAIEDLLIRWKRMQGYSALWVPGTDHAGFETQTTYERKLKKQGKSRFNFDRETLYNDIWNFVQENKGLIDEQMKSMGASVDWSRYTFTLDENVVKTVCDTFAKMYEEGLVYKGDYVVNYSFKWGTTFSDAEITYLEKKRPLYYVTYKLKEKSKKGENTIVIATTRPETIFVDTHIAVHPDDKKTNHLIGHIALNPLTDEEMTIIGDNYVDPKVGTGIVKLTPAHDKNDFEIALRHDLPIINIISLDGKITSDAVKYADMKILDARNSAVEELTKKGTMHKIDETYVSLVPVDYRSGDYVENLVLPNWFIKVKDLKKPALNAIKNGELKIYPKWREITYTRWVEGMYDWAISRQVVWGIRIPVWYSVDKNPRIKVSFLSSKSEVISGFLGDLLKDYTYNEIKSGLQTLVAPKDAELVVSQVEPSGEYLQETDTFDTWFSSGQWPLVTLGYPDSEDYKYFYPTDVLETGWEIITRWVSRMVMFGYYATGKSPFKDVYLHGLVRAIDGKKMSKSLGNVINPEDYLQEFGADALRMGLIVGTANGKDFNFPRDKVIAYRNFANKIWNMTRFMLMMMEKEGFNENNPLPFYSSEMNSKLNTQDMEILQKLSKTIKSVNTHLEKYRFAHAGDEIYSFMWNDLASNYIEHVKDREDKDIALSVFRHVFINSLKLLHPFMPFVTEEIWSYIPRKCDEPLVISMWPKL